MRFLILLLCSYSLTVNAESFSVKVLTSDGEPIGGAVVELELVSPQTNPDLLAQASVDQINKRFVPHIIAVHKGSQVIFPNSDSIKHHVYSFSPAKTFELKLYRESLPTPIHLENEGVVAMGCSVHDWMSGYIYVAESQFFGQTDSDGVYQTQLPAAVKSITVWHPRFHEQDVERGRNIPANNAEFTFTLTKVLYPNQDITVDELSEYE